MKITFYRSSFRLKTFTRLIAAGAFALTTQASFAACTVSNLADCNVPVINALSDKIARTVSTLSLSNVVTAGSQNNTGEVVSITNVYTPVATNADFKSVSVGNSISAAVDRTISTAANQINSGRIDAGVVTTGANGNVSNMLSISAVSVGNSFSIQTPPNTTSQLASSIVQINSGALRAATQYNQVDPSVLNISSTAVGNSISFSKLVP